MSLELTDEQLATVVDATQAGHTAIDREVLWQWRLSRVERVFLVGGETFILKRSRAPLTLEAEIIESLAASSVPLPALRFFDLDGEHLSMVLEDLGPRMREVTLREAVRTAAGIHSTPALERLLVLDEAALAALPTQMRRGIDQLNDVGRWSATEAVSDLLLRVTRIGPALSHGATTPPFGLCHGEFHPTSLHVGERKFGVLDWQRAFIGPGVLDLASFNGTTLPPDHKACRQLIELYIDEGGSPHAGDARAGLPAEKWALFWHRLWIVDWFISSCATWMQDRSQDSAYQSTVERHLTEALNLVA